MLCVERAIGMSATLRIDKLRALLVKQNVKHMHAGNDGDDDGKTEREIASAGKCGQT